MFTWQYSQGQVLGQVSNLNSAAYVNKKLKASSGIY